MQKYNNLWRVLYFLQFKQRLVNYFIGLFGSLHVLEGDFYLCILLG